MSDNIIRTNFLQWQLYLDHWLAFHVLQIQITLIIICKVRHLVIGFHELTGYWCCCC